MPWFICDNCGESLKKPKVASHAGQCGSNSFTCIDCSRTFDRRSVAGHTTCVTEHEKYAQGATKPGGYAANGCFAAAGGPAAAPVPTGGEIVGAEFLSQRPPWKCSICNVAATSRESLEGHASGAKHQRRARAALAAREAPSTVQTGEGQSGEAAPRQAAPPTDAPPEPPATPVRDGPTPSDKASRKRAREVGGGAGTQAAADKPGKAEAKAKIKWKKLAAAELRRAGGGMKLKKLVAAVLAAAGVEDGSKPELLAKLTASSQFKLDDKRVELVEA